MKSLWNLFIGCAGIVVASEVMGKILAYPDALNTKNMDVVWMELLFTAVLMWSFYNLKLYFKN